MERFKSLTLVEIGHRYKGTDFQLVTDLMQAGLIEKEPPECHGLMKILEADAWHWRCNERTCSKKLSVITEKSFLFKKKKVFSVIISLYMWSKGLSQAQITAESGRCRQQVGTLCNEWRSIIAEENEREPQLGKRTASTIIECDETAVSGSIYYCCCCLVVDA